MADATARSLQYEYKAVSEYLARNSPLFKIARVQCFTHFCPNSHVYLIVCLVLYMVCSSAYYSVYSMFLMATISLVPGAGCTKAG